MVLHYFLQPASKIPCSGLLASVGFIALTLGFSALLRQATVYLLPCKLQRYKSTRKDKNWALVTGATDGIGFGFCQELCARGFNVLLMGRNGDKLHRRAAELRQQFPMSSVDTIVMDAVSVNSEIDNLANALPGQLTVLVNNLGGGESRPYLTLGEYTFEELQTTINKNAVFMAQLTRVLLPVLSRAERSLVLNISSMSAWGCPYVSTYAATKGFVETFTRALQGECAAEKNGIDVMGLKVGQTSTPGYNHPPSMFIPTARVMAKAGLDRVGCGKTIVCGYFLHWLQGLSFTVLPRALMLKVLTRKMMALKKDKQEKAKTK
jgi:17beta-estradiol 17-dehydrogenase / very-long-chain 3-oxoacyl-CoA reductase